MIENKNPPNYRTVEVVPEARCCGLCFNAQTYNEDMDCWCNRYNRKVDESFGTCDKWNEEVEPLNAKKEYENE